VHPPVDAQGQRDQRADQLGTISIDVVEAAVSGSGMGWLVVRS
jgi:hypothetical protein